MEYVTNVVIVFLFPINRPREGGTLNIWTQHDDRDLGTFVCLFVLRVWVEGGKTGVGGVASIGRWLYPS